MASNLRPVALRAAFAALVAAGMPSLAGAGDTPQSSNPGTPPTAVVTIDPAGNLAAAYRSLYLAFTDSDRAAAIDRAAAFERDALAADPKKGFDHLTEADSRLFGAIAANDPDALAPLVRFYRGLADRHLADRNYGLLLRANRSTERLLYLRGRAATNAAEKAAVAEAYSGFAADLLDLLAADRAGEMLERALELAPGDVPANLTLAILLQRDERYPAAALRLEQALQTEPENREALLRRALLRIKIDADRAAKELEKLAAGTEGDWITVVATQERGRMLLERKRWDRAIAWFDGASHRFPAESGFRAALAFAQSQGGHRTTATDTAAAALRAPRLEDASARIRFAASPVRLLEAARDATRAADERHWGELRVALAAISPPADAATGVAR